MKATYLSAATERNWIRLKTDGSKRLKKRANKKNSTKRILPTEYFIDIKNIEFVQNMVNWVSRNSVTLCQVIYSFAENLLERKGILCCSHVQCVLQEYSIQTIPYIRDIEIPNNEWDILGLMYQSMLLEGKKNELGSYYTPKSIVKDMTKDFDFSQNELFLDPCCGSGSFLLALNCDYPELLFGIDKDPLAVFITKINLLLKYSDKVFVPHVFCVDYLSPNYAIFDNEELYKKFDYIATNPPWGAVSDTARVPKEITSKESFSIFFVNAYRQLKDEGIIRFLFPSSILNVKKHKDIRKYLLNCGLKQITLYDSSFSGVTTKFIEIACRKTYPEPIIYFKDRKGLHEIHTSSFRQTKHLVFAFLNQDDLDILHLIKEKGKYNLSRSVWALGIVTGDNEGKLKSFPETGTEPIYTGKEIQRYILKPAENYIVYDREQLQQVAKEEYYRAPEKLVYKFISNRLIFAYDDTQSLFLNSANILIPSIPNMSIKTVLAFLNSELFQFLYSKMFGEPKILKGNLIELPFPEISLGQNKVIESLIDKVLLGDTGQDEVLQNTIYTVYTVSEKQKKYIRRSINGTVN